MHPKDSAGMTNSVGLDQTGAARAVWSAVCVP